MNYDFNKLLKIDPLLQISGVFINNTDCEIRFNYSDSWKQSHEHFPPKPLHIEHFTSKEKALQCLLDMMKLADIQEAKLQ